jgi:hypothetical protein
MTAGHCNFGFLRIGLPSKRSSFTRSLQLCYVETFADERTPACTPAVYSLSAIWPSLRMADPAEHRRPLKQGSHIK